MSYLLLKTIGVVDLDEMIYEVILKYDTYFGMGEGTFLGLNLSLLDSRTLGHVIGEMLG